tara:strand:- start:481 stop:978 length:498 start_codon:yes stop_codon:yes gene_type:complete
MRTLQNIDAELKDLNSIINNLYTLQETAKNDEEHDACQVEIDRYCAERHRLETKTTEVLMNTVCTSDLANPETILSLSDHAFAKAQEIVRRKEREDFLILTKIYERYDFIEWRFNDGSFVEIEILRDFNNDMKPYAVQVMEFVEHTDQRGTSFYKLVAHYEYDVK